MEGRLQGPLQGAPGRGVPLQGLLQPADEGGEGGAELVGRVADEAPLRFQKPFQGVQEEVLRPGQAAHLVQARGLGEPPLGVGGLGEGQGSPGHAVQGGEGPPREEVAEEEGQGQGPGEGQEEEALCPVHGPVRPLQGAGRHQPKAFPREGAVADLPLAEAPFGEPRGQGEGGAPLGHRPAPHHEVEGEVRGEGLALGLQQEAPVLLSHQGFGEGEGVQERGVQGPVEGGL